MDNTQIPEEPAPQELETHETIILGIENGAIVFFRSFHYATQKEEAQAVLAQVEKKYPAWIISHIGHWILENKQDNEIYQFKIPLK